MDSQVEKILFDAQKEIFALQEKLRDDSHLVRTQKEYDYLEKVMGDCDIAIKWLITIRSIPTQSKSDNQ